jgi:hypothetical protein
VEAAAPTSRGSNMWASLGMVPVPYGWRRGGGGGGGASPTLFRLGLLLFVWFHQSAMVCRASKLMLNPLLGVSQGIWTPPPARLWRLKRLPCQTQHQCLPIHLPHLCLRLCRQERRRLRPTTLPAKVSRCDTTLNSLRFPSFALTVFGASRARPAPLKTYPIVRLGPQRSSAAAICSRGTAMKTLRIETLGFARGDRE